MSNSEIKTHWIGGPPYKENGETVKEEPEKVRANAKVKIEPQRVILNSWPAEVVMSVGSTVITVKVSAIGVTTVFRDGRRLMVMPLPGKG